MLFVSTAALSLLLVGASAAPKFSNSTKSRQFTVYQVPVDGDSSLLGPVAGRDTLLKYGARVPEWLNDAADNAIQSAALDSTSDGSDNGNGGTGDAPVTQSKSQRYLTPITIADKVFNLNIDTGSSDLWVYSTLQPAEQLAGHTYFDTSSGTVLPGEKWKVEYADNSDASGLVYQANVTVGGITAARQAVDAASVISDRFRNETETDGVFGFGFSNGNRVLPHQQKTWFDNVKDDLASPIFAARLRKGEPGSYDFGFVNNSAFKDDLTYTNVDSSDGHWKIAVSGYAVGANHIKAVNLSTVAVDTGSAVIGLPYRVVVDYYINIPSSKLNGTAGGFIVACNATLPSFSLVVEGKTLTVPGSNLMGEPVAIPGFEGMCSGQLQFVFSFEQVTILGAPFLQAYYTVFDSNGPRVGFAPQVDVDVTPGGRLDASTDCLVAAANLFVDYEGGMGIFI